MPAKALLSAVSFVLLAQASPALAHATSHAHHHGWHGGAGVSAIWIWANLCYAGMRAQAHPSTAWRVVSFVFGFPGTLVSFFAVKEGGERAYGIELPKRSVSGGGTP